MKQIFKKKMFLTILLPTGLIGLWGLFVFSMFFMIFMGETAYNGTDFLYLGFLRFFLPFLPLVFMIFFGYCLVRILYLVYKNKEIIQKTKEKVFGYILLLSPLYPSYLLSSIFYQLFSIFFKQGTLIFFSMQETSVLKIFLLIIAPFCFIISSLLLGLFYIGIIKIKKK